MTSGVLVEGEEDEVEDGIEGLVAGEVGELEPELAEDAGCPGLAC
jgi:hypothetical protein